MKKNLLALSVATLVGGLGFTGVASADVIRFANGDNGVGNSTATAMEFASDGIGNVLLVPYFTAQNGNATALHLVNTDTVNGKAVKVRFRGAANSDDILDFTLFMSPGDVWSGAVSMNAETGIAQISTRDTSCTVPAINGSQSFVTSRLNPNLSAEQLAAGTREGYIEILNMADIPPATGNNGAHSGLYSAIKHPANNAPSCDANVLNSEDAPRGVFRNFTEEGQARAAGFRAPSTGLMGSWYILNVDQTVTFSGAADALRSVNAAGNAAPGNFVYFPQSDEEVLGDVARWTADPLIRQGHLAAAYYDLPDLSTAYAGANVGMPAAAIDLTTALARRTVLNQYELSESLNAATDWVMSMPTRRYWAAVNYGAAGNARRVVTTQEGFVAPNENPWFTTANTVLGENSTLCVNAGNLTFYDTEENTQGRAPVFSPGNTSTPRICGETYVLSFNDDGASVLGAEVARQNVPASYNSGWAMLDLTNRDRNARGLPILGAAFIKGTNEYTANGVSGNYGITWRHGFR